MSNPYTKEDEAEVAKKRHHAEKLARNDEILQSILASADEIKASMARLERQWYPTMSAMESSVVVMNPNLVVNYIPTPVEVREMDSPSALQDEEIINLVTDSASEFSEYVGSKSSTVFSVSVDPIEILSKTSTLATPKSQADILEPESVVESPFESVNIVVKNELQIVAHEAESDDAFFADVVGDVEEPVYNMILGSKHRVCDDPSQVEMDSWIVVPRLLLELNKVVPSIDFVFGLVLSNIKTDEVNELLRVGCTTDVENYSAKFCSPYVCRNDSMLTPSLVGTNKSIFGCWCSIEQLKTKADVVCMKPLPLPPDISGTFILCNGWDPVTELKMLKLQVFGIEDHILMIKLEGLPTVLCLEEYLLWIGAKSSVAIRCFLSTCLPLMILTDTISEAAKLEFGMELVAYRMEFVKTSLSNLVTFRLPETCVSESTFPNDPWNHFKIKEPILFENSGNSRQRWVNSTKMMAHFLCYMASEHDMMIIKAVDGLFLETKNMVESMVCNFLTISSSAGLINQFDLGRLVVTIPSDSKSDLLQTLFRICLPRILMGFMLPLTGMECHIKNSSRRVVLAWLLSVNGCVRLEIMRKVQWLTNFDVTGEMLSKRHFIMFQYIHSLSRLPVPARKRRSAMLFGCCWIWGSVPISIDDNAPWVHAKLSLLVVLTLNLIKPFVSEFVQFYLNNISSIVIVASNAKVLQVGLFPQHGVSKISMNSGVSTRIIGIKDCVCFMKKISWLWSTEVIGKMLLKLHIPIPYQSRALIKREFLLIFCWACGSTHVSVIDDRPGRHVKLFSQSQVNEQLFSLLLDITMWRLCQLGNSPVYISFITEAFSSQHQLYKLISDVGIFDWSFHRNDGTKIWKALLGTAKRKVFRKSGVGITLQSAFFSDLIYYVKRECVMASVFQLQWQLLWLLNINIERTVWDFKGGTNISLCILMKNLTKAIVSSGANFKFTSFLMTSHLDSSMRLSKNASFSTPTHLWVSESKVEPSLCSVVHMTDVDILFVRRSNVGSILRGRSFMVAGSEYDEIFQIFSWLVCVQQTIYMLREITSTMVAVWLFWWLLFSLPRPPKFSDLEDKVNLKDRGIDTYIKGQ